MEATIQSSSTHKIELSLCTQNSSVSPMDRVSVRGIDWDYSRNDPSPPDFSRTLPKPKTTVFGVFIYIFKSKESIETIPKMIRALPTFPELSRFCPNTPEGYKHRVWYLPLYFRVRGIDWDYSRNDPSPPDFSRTLPKPKTTVFGVFIYIFKSKESIETIPKMIRALPTFPELSRFCPNTPEGYKHRVWYLPLYFRVQGTDFDRSQNDPSTPELARTLSKPKIIVFGAFAHIFKSKESIATIPEMLRALPNYPDISRTLPKARNTVFVWGIDCDYSRSDTNTPDFARIIPILPELFRRLETACLVRGIDCDCSRSDTRTPKLGNCHQFPQIAKRVTAYPLQQFFSSGKMRGRRPRRGQRSCPIAAKLPAGGGVHRRVARLPKSS
ncbi:hypothetical protein NQ317_005693 [Molorchus minor]|uniref:Uncharacterized protein n=1 Tax=Molorchus minor TaxID=1323400 RepID=A0ABQ9J591_9CUCU|nr:hypothetical protein NQ317_005693 [Molorchus minor]